MENETNPNPEELNKALEKYHEIIQAAELNAKDEVESLVKDMLCRIEAKDPRFVMNWTIHDGTDDNLAECPIARRYFDAYLSITELNIDELSAERPLSEESEHTHTTYPLKPELQEKWKDLAGKEGKLLSSDLFLDKFSDLVEQAVKDMNASEKYEYKFINQQNYNDVAVTFEQGDTTTYHVNLKPVIKLKTWPDDFSVGWKSRSKNSWPSGRVITKIRESAIFLSPSYGSDWNIEAKCNFKWKFNFDECIHQMFIERGSSLPNNNCCGDVVRILHRMRIEFDWRFLCSLELRTTMLYEFETFNDKKKWQKSKVGERVLSVLRRLKDFLIEKKCMHYFIPDFNQITTNCTERGVRKIDEVLADPLRAISNLIGNHQRKRTLSKILNMISKLLESPLIPVLPKVGDETESSTSKENTKNRKQGKRKGAEEQRCDDAENNDKMEVDENDENESVLLAQEMEIDEENVGAALPAQEFEVVSIPSEICDELGDLLDGALDFPWRSGLMSSRDDEGGLLLLHEMLGLADDMDDSVYFCREKVKAMFNVRKALLWNGQKPCQYSKKDLFIKCNIHQHSFERLAKSLHCHHFVEIAGNLEFICNDSVPIIIASDSKANLIYLEELIIAESASLSEGAWVYLATLIPFVEKVTIKEQDLCTRFSETLMSTCKDLGYKVKTKELRIIRCRENKGDISRLTEFFPLVHEVQLNGMKLSSDCVGSIVVAVAKTAETGAREGSELPLRHLSIKECNVSEEGFGCELMTMARFIEEIKLIENNISLENLKAMARCLSDLRSCDETKVPLRKLTLCCKSLGGNGLGADIMNLGSLIEHFDLSDNDSFDADDIHRMSTTLSQLMKEDKDQVQLKILNLKRCRLANKEMGGDLIKLMSLIEDVDFGENRFGFHDFSQMNLALTELENENMTPICTKKLSLRRCCLGDQMIGKYLMNLASFIKEVELNDNRFTFDDLMEMRETISELAEHDQSRFRIKELSLGDDGLEWQDFSVESMKLVSLVEDVNLGGYMFHADDICKMSAALLELSTKGLVRIKHLNLHGCAHEYRLVGKDLMQLAILVEEFGTNTDCFDADDFYEMAAVISESLQSNKNDVCLKKLHLRWRRGIGTQKGIMTLISLIEEVDLHGDRFSVNDLREMRADLSELLQADPNQVRLKKLKLSHCSLNKHGKGKDLMKLGCFVEELDISENKFNNYDLRKMSSALSKMLETNKECVRIKKLNLSKCSLKTEYGEILVNLIQNLEEVNLCFNSLVAEDIMLIAKFLEDGTVEDSSCKDLRTMTLLLSVDPEITGYARMAFFVKEIQTNSCETAVRLLTQMAELATEFGLRGRKCRMKTLKVISSLRDSKVQELEDLAQDIGVEVIVINQVDCDWIEPERYRQEKMFRHGKRFSPNRFKLFINGSSDEAQLTTHVIGTATFSIPDEGVEWELSRVSCDIDLAIGEAILGDIISICPEGKVFTKPAKLKIPYNIYDVPEFTEVVCERFDLDSNQWERIIAVFSRDGNGVRYATANIHVSTKYMITLRVKKYISMIPSSGITITPFGQRIGIDVTFPSDTFKKDNQRVNFKVNKFTAQAIQHLKVLGYKISPMLHMTIQNDAIPQEIINVKLPIDTSHAEAGQLILLCWNGHEFRDITNEANPILHDNAVVCEAIKNSSIIAVIREFDVHGGVDKLGANILKYSQPQISIRFSLYGQEMPDKRLCVAASRIEDQANVEEEFRLSKFELISTSLARQGVFKDTQMKVDVPGPFDPSAWDRVRLRFLDSNRRSSLKFNLKRKFERDNTVSTDVEHNVIFTDDSGQIIYGSLPFKLPLLNDATMTSMMGREESEPLRFLGLKLDDCYLEDLNLQNQNEIHKLRSLGLQKKEVKTIKEKMRVEGNTSAVSYSWKRITDAFMRGDLDKYRFANFEKLEPRHMRNRIRRVIEFLSKRYEDDNAQHNMFLEEVFQSKIFEQNDILTVFGSCLHLTRNDIKKIAEDAKIASLRDHKPAENHCCKLILYSALSENEVALEDNLLKIVMSLMKTKLHFKTFTPESGKEAAVQSLLDDLGKCVEDHLFTRNQ